MKISKWYMESTLNFIISQNSDKNWLDTYLIDLWGFLDLRGLFWVIFIIFENFEIIFGIYIKFYYKSKLWQKFIGYTFNWFIRIFGIKGSFFSYFFNFWKFWNHIWNQNSDKSWLRAYLNEFNWLLVTDKKKEKEKEKIGVCCLGCRYQQAEE